MKKDAISVEITSFNRTAFEMPTLLELSEMELEQVTGGQSDGLDLGHCGTLTCGTVLCNNLSCGSYEVLEK